MGSDGVPRWVISLLKWAALLLFLAVVVTLALPRAIEAVTNSFTFGSAEEEETEPEEDAGPPSLDTGSGEAMTDLAVRNGTVRDATADVLTFGPDLADTVLISFEPIPLDPACLTDVVLSVFLVESVPTQVYAAPAQLLDIAGLSDGDPLAADALFSGQQVTAITNGSPGFLQWSITEEYTLAARSATAGAQVVLALTVSVPEDPLAQGTTTLAAVDGLEQQRATLTWSAVQGCSDLLEAGPTATVPPATLAPGTTAAPTAAPTTTATPAPTGTGELPAEG